MTKIDRAFDVDEPRFTHSGGLERRKVFVGGKVGTTEHVALRAPDSLSRLASRGTISDRQRLAAEMWATDYERAGMGVVVVASYSHGVIAGSEPEPERRRAAKERFRLAYADMTKGASVVWAVVIENSTLKTWAHARSIDPRTATRLFLDGLDELAAFYGIPIQRS